MRRLIGAIFLILISEKFSYGSNYQLESWRKVIIDTARDQALPPNLTVRNLAIICMGSFECVNAEKRTYSSLLNLQREIPQNYDPDSAIRGCMLELCNSLHPAQKDRFTELAHQLSVKKGVRPHNPSFVFGQSIAQKILLLRSNDGASTQINYIGKEEPGKWRRTPPHFRPPEQPNWGQVKLFCLESKLEFLPPPPPELDSQEYFDAVKEVKIYGSTNYSLRTKDQTLSAKFWKDFSYTSTPPGHWNEIALFAARQEHLPKLEEARLFALLNLAMADAGVIAWQAKYKYSLWRPIDAIRKANELPTTARLCGPAWNSLLESPPHPEYPSGHGCYSGAAAEVLQFFFKTDSFHFSAKSDSLPHVKRSFSSFSACAQEIANSRLWGGIHFKFSNQKALQSGSKVAKYICNNFCTFVTN
jgi:hypothetical protein